MIDDHLSSALASLEAEADPWSDLETLCALGGRFAGTDSEHRAAEFLASRLAEMGTPVESLPVGYAGWERGESNLQAGGRRFACESLVRSPATPPEGLRAPLIDLGRGSEEDFRRLADRITGHVVMVRHEYMFTTGTLHRRRKYGWAMEHGAAGFLIASHLPGELPVTGSSGATPGNGIPAAGISAETAAALTDLGMNATVHLHIETRETPARTRNLLLDLPGRGAEQVVLCAHLDGHHLAQSAMDNATGLAAVLACARALAPLCEHLERGLRVMFFSVEEWALAGSKQYVEGLTPKERSDIVCTINLDSVAGSRSLTALTSGYDALPPFLTRAAREAGQSLGIHEPLMANSDHYNFAVSGIPALRLVAGFDEPDSNLRYVLTPQDRIEHIQREELLDATRLATTLALRACSTPDLDLRRSRDARGPEGVQHKIPGVAR